MALDRPLMRIELPVENWSALIAKDNPPSFFGMGDPEKTHGELE
jgi:hypothetical protein